MQRMDAKDVRLSEAGRDCLYELVEKWLGKHLSPELAEEIKESDGKITELVEGVREIMRIEVALQLAEPLRKPQGG